MAETTETPVLNDTGIKPVGYKILVEIPEVDEQLGNGLVMPSYMRDKIKTQSVTARVLEVGEYAYRDESRFLPDKPWCKVGDMILMSAYAGTRISYQRKSGAPSRELRFVNEDAIDGVMLPDSDYTNYGRGV